MAKYNGDLEIEIDDSQQRKTWVIERIAWVILLIFILAGFAGFFGRGGVNKRTIGSEEEGMKNFFVIILVISYVLQFTAPCRIKCSGFGYLMISERKF